VALAALFAFTAYSAQQRIKRARLKAKEADPTGQRLRDWKGDLIE
jgi:predicted metal-dependent hydrolase